MTLTTMKFATAAALLLTLEAAASADARPITKYKSNGAFAEILGSDDTGCRYFYVYVARGGTTAAPETFLYYDMYDWCTDTWALGFGLVPNGSLVIKKANVNINTSGRYSSSFYTEGESLDITLTLTKDGVFTQRSSGHVRIEYPNGVIQRHGTWTYYSASVSGTFGGTAVSTQEAITGTGKDHYMEFDPRAK